jgi:hypothetical protein
LQSDKNANRHSVVSDDDEYVLPDGEYVFPDSPHYENNEIVPVFEPPMSPPLSPSPESGPTKRPVPGRQKRVPPPKPKRTPSIQSDISNDGYEDMSRGSFASVALSSIGAEVYSVPRYVHRQFYAYKLNFFSQNWELISSVPSKILRKLSLILCSLQIRKEFYIHVRMPLRTLCTKPYRTGLKTFSS